MARQSNADNRTWSIPLDLIPNFTTYCKGTDLRGVTISVHQNSFSSDAPALIMSSFKSALRLLSSVGAQIVNNSNFTGAEEFKKLNQQVKGIVRLPEFKRDIVEYLHNLETNPNNIQSAEDIIEFTKTTPEERYPERNIGKFLWT